MNDTEAERPLYLRVFTRFRVLVQEITNHRYPWNFIAELEEGTRIIRAIQKTLAPLCVISLKKSERAGSKIFIYSVYVVYLLTLYTRRISSVTEK